MDLFVFLGKFFEVVGLIHSPHLVLWVIDEALSNLDLVTCDPHNATNKQGSDPILGFHIIVAIRVVYL